LVGKGQLLLPLFALRGTSYGFEIQTLWNQLTPEQQQIILYGAEKSIWIEDRNDYRRYAGVIPMLQRQYSDSSELLKQSWSHI